MDADKIFVLQKKIFQHVKPDDAHTMVYMLQENIAGPIKLDVWDPMWVIKDGEIPAVYVGFPW